MKKFSILLVMLLIGITFSFPHIASADTQDYYIDYDTEKVAMLGGNSFRLELVGATGDVSWQVHNLLLCDISGDNTGVTVMPKSSGVAIISAKSGDKTCYAQINIIDVASAQDARIVINGFNRANEDITIKFSALGYEKFYNFQATWQVLDGAGNSLPFIDNGESIFISKENANVGDYTVKISSPGFSPMQETLTVSQLNADEILNKALPILAILVTVILVLVIISKRVGTKLNSVYKSFKSYVSYYKKANTKISQGVNKLIFNDKVSKLSLSLKNITGNVQILNMDNFGYYQRLQDLMMQACSALDASLVYKNYSEKFAVEFFEKFNEIYLLPIQKMIEQLLAMEKVREKKPLTEVDKINLESQEMANRFVKNYANIDEILNAGKSFDDDDDDDDD